MEGYFFSTIPKKSELIHR